MNRMVSVVGLVLSLGMIYVAYAETPEAAGVENPTAEAVGDGCVIREVPLDEGYGVTRTEKRIVCAQE